MACQVSRDPFARETTYRETIRVSLAAGGCAWCGAKRPSRSPSSPDYFLFRYYVQTDGGRRSALAGGRNFCGIRCLRAFTS
jgi:hypothetical protein